MTRIRTVLAALVIVAAAAGTASAQAIAAITSRTPSRGDAAGGTTVELLGTGWFGRTTTVAMSGAGLQPTNVVVDPNGRRLTFVTPPRPASLTGYTITVTTPGTVPTVRTTNFFYVAKVRTDVPSARKPVFSYDGQFVAFESRFALLQGDTNGLIDIYVRNRNTGAVRRVSVSSTGGQALGGESTNPAISANGRFVAFQSRATNLVPGDTNGLMDVFVHDRDADDNGIFDEAGKVRTERVSLGQDTAAANAIARTQALGGDSSNPVISGNGRYVAYQSSATNLVGPNIDGNRKIDVFAFDRMRRVTRLMSTTFDGQLADGHSRKPAMSLSGRWVVFESLADNLAGGNPGNPQTGQISDIILHDRDTDEDGVYDENLNVGNQLVSVNRCEQNLTNHSIDPSITYDGRFVVFATVASNAKVDENCAPDDRNRARDIFIWDRLFGAVTRRLSEGGQGELPGASGAPIISGNGNLLLFRTQAVNAGSGPSSPGTIVAAAGEDGKSTTGGVPSPTTDTPPPADVPPPPPTGSTEDPATSGDGNTTGNTVEPDPGTGEGEPEMELEETPPDADGTPFIAGLSPSAGPTAGGAIVEIQGANFLPGAQTTVQWNNTTLPPANVAFLTSSLLRVTTPAAFVDGPVPVRVVSALEASNEVQYTYSAGLTAPSISSFAPTTATIAGGVPLTINGAGFSNPSVRFGANGASVLPGGDATHIFVTVPVESTAGPVPIIVTNSDGAVAVSSTPFTYTFATVNAAPVVQPLTPDHGPVTGGTAITITGQNFAPGATVTVGAVPATDVQVFGNTQIVAVTPAGAEGPADVVVTVNGTSSPAQTFVYDPVSEPVLTCNLTNNDLDGDGAADDWELQYGFNPGDPTDGALDPDNDLQTNAQECAALTHPRGLYTRYLAEGATGSFFDTRVVVANPGVTPARLLFRFMTETGAVIRAFRVLPAQSRRTIDARLLAGLAAANISTVVESDVQVVVDRTMRWDQVSRQGAHAESSTPAPSLVWYLAEGATHGSFDLFYLLQNPSPTQTAQVEIRYLLPSGPPILQTVSVAPNSRQTVYVDQQPGLSATDVSAVLTSLNGVPIIVERAMYSSAAGTFAAGHDSAGVTSPSLDWFFAEGATGSFFDTFILLANPGASASNVHATYLLPSGQTVHKDYVVPANSRRTLNVQLEDPQLAATSVSTRLTSTNAVPFLAERSMWWPHGQAWFEAHNAAGATTTGTRWGVGDGEVGLLPEDTATFLLIANTSDFAGTARVTLLFETGAAITQDFALPGNARFNVPILSSESPASPTYMRVPRGTRFSAVVESLGVTPPQIVVERAMYWNANGQLWAAGSDLLATKLQ
jgi:Tol biopolymer transport system component